MKGLADHGGVVLEQDVAFVLLDAGAFVIGGECREIAAAPERGEGAVHALDQGREGKRAFAARGDEGDGFLDRPIRAVDDAGPVLAKACDGGLEGLACFTALCGIGLAQDARRAVLIASN